MNSPEKVFALIAHLEQAPDEDLPGGIPPTMLLAALPFIVDMIPRDPAELDTLLTDVGDFCHSMRSDQPAVTA